MAKEQKSFFLEETKMPLMITDYDWDGADMHWHNYWEMLLQCEGETRISVGEEQFVSRPGNVTIIEPNRLHETRSITDRHKILLIQFEKSVLMPFIDSNGGNNYLSLLVDDGFVVRNQIEKSDEAELGNAFMELREAAIGKKAGYEFELYSRLLHIMFLLLNKEYITIPHIKDETKRALLSIRNAMLYIDQNYQSRIRQEEMAEMCYMSTAHFSRRFKMATGQNMVDYVNKIRLKEAERLLVSSKCNILEISQQTGFSTVNYFNRVFKKAYGMSPREYRNKIV